jgi:cytochrome c-type biogenesis protein
MNHISQIGMVATFGAGIISFLSPCVLPLVPGFVSYFAGQSAAGRVAPGQAPSRLQAIALSLCFVLGFSTVFVLLGASATALGQMLLTYRYELNLVGGAIVVGFGLFTVGAMRLSWLQRDLRLGVAVPRARPFAAYLLGLAFAFGWSPCIGPVLGSILTVGATSATVVDGIALLATYSLGLGLPFVVAATLADGLLTRLKSAGLIGRVLRLTAGSVMIVMGVAMITGQLSAFSYWLLETFPSLGLIG